jgi:hypothetical protein
MGALLIHPSVGRVEVAFDGTLPLLGLADVPWSHLTREFLVIDALTGRRGGAYAEMGLAEVFT